MDSVDFGSIHGGLVSRLCDVGSAVGFWVGGMM